MSLDPRPDLAGRDGVGLPAPTGPYRVGRRSIHWIDESRREPDGAPRELLVWIWYPAEADGSAPVAEYLPAGWEVAAGLWGFKADGVASHAVADPPVATGSERFPVLVFSPAGFPPLLLSAMLEEMASHGYVVAGINHTYQTAVSVFPNGRIVPMDAARMQPAIGPFSGVPEETFKNRASFAEQQAADIDFVVAQLEMLNGGGNPLSGRLDMELLGAFGHSLGGNAALEFARASERCRAVVNLDGGVWSTVGQVGVQAPSLMILAEHAEFALPCADIVQAGAYPSIEWCEAERNLNIAAWQTVYERAQPGYAVMLRGSGHISFMDVPFMPVEPGSMVAAGLVNLRIDAARAWRLISDTLLAFFATHLDGSKDPAISFDAPELVSGAPRDLISSLGTQ